MKRLALKWELIGIAAISVLGSLLHFVFELSGELAPVGIFAAVNESVFEHLKLTYWPTLVYAACTYRIIRNSSNNFIIAKTAGIYVMPLSIIVLFYAYTIITGTEILIVDILIFIVAVALGQLTSYKLLTMNRLPNSLHWIALSLLVALAVIYGVFTFYPPQVPFFQDPVSDTYGI
ncbi:DUF6512 family protein [Chloroflexota bacterium]